ncbi:hypothetical protein [Microbacterium pygmaeum]|uniref:Uncharacterized protein n=1 Tax=Microbacterium pygmaeum TaxID=370764 RepID=A0A1G8AKI6_9MICO|nr:hypothetical protein [Microbacterium pygmaeum]SDH21484.1 hypothetical protein SAMN04489810_2405 [Microbacterium pygmaeum]
MNEYDWDDQHEVRFRTSGDHPARSARSAADEVSEIARHGDPSLERLPLSLSGSERVRSEVVWMRPTELVPVVTGRIAGQGIDLESSIARRARALPTQGIAVTRGAIRDRAIHLPPVTAFGSGRHIHNAVRRSGIGR